jgi:hypothetical protein
VIIEMLEGAAAKYDFAVVILAKDDVMIGGKGETLKARDNCVFEAGLFMSAIGRKRCFLVNSVGQSDLPSDLNGIISIPFKEPANLGDHLECARAITKVAGELKSIVQREGPSGYHTRLPLLSVEEVFRRERPRSEGGDLSGGEVVVCDVQPAADVARAEIVRHNMDNGTSYHYFFQFSDDTVEKLCQALQMIAWAGVGGAGPSDFRSRVDAITGKKDRVLDDLRTLCRTGLLRFSLIVDEPVLWFRAHNASNPAEAKLYTRHFEGGFVRWAEGQIAASLWRQLPKFLEDDTADRLFVSMRYEVFGAEQRQRLSSTLSRVLSRYFPGMELEVKQVCLGGKS